MKKLLAMMLTALLILACMNCCAETSTEPECIGEHFTIDVIGVTLNYEVAGEGKPVVLVHGNGGRHEVFSVEIKQLVDTSYNVYAVDSRGQGANEPLEKYHYADMAEDMFQFITGLGLDKPAYYGWSDGGIIGLMLEIAHPGMVGLMAISGANLNPEGASPDIIAMISAAVEENPDPLAGMMLTEPNIAPRGPQENRDTGAGDRRKRGRDPARAYPAHRRQPAEFGTENRRGRRPRNIHSGQRNHGQSAHRLPADA